MNPLARWHTNYINDVHGWVEPWECIAAEQVLANFQSGGRSAM